MTGKDAREAAAAHPAHTGRAARTARATRAARPSGSGAAAGTSSETREPRDRLIWLDALKGAAIVWIILNHLSEAIWGGPYLANPSPHWPPLGERIAQFAPLWGHGVWNWPLNLLRWVGWLGDQGVQLFLIASGFGLAWGLLARGGAAGGDRTAGALPRLDTAWFFRRRVARVYPQWWGAHVLVLAPAFLLGWGIFAVGVELVLSLAGIRFLPRTFYWAFPAWWFIGLLLQLYVVFPLLWAGLRRWGEWRLLIVCVALGLVFRAGMIAGAGPRIDMMLRGALFPSRLPEFTLGIALAAWLHGSPVATRAWLRAPSTLILALLVWLGGNAASATLWGMTVAPLLSGAGAFVLLWALLAGATAGGGAARGRPGWLVWFGVHSYAIYLVHHPLAMLLVDRRHPTVWGALAAIVLIFPAALLLERGTAGAQALVSTWRRRAGWAGAGLGLAATGALAVACGLFAEVAVRRFDPQEVHGWGERPSLQPDGAFGWKLVPSRTTRLRWLSYDYTVKANALGFPGPEYPAGREPGSLRILVTGDAFTSAEGVDTELAWPRLLEEELTRSLPGRRVEVLNFAVTGYGPNQYAAVIDSFAPLYRPDLVVIGLFGNDFLDVQVGDDDFRRGIGFGGPPLSGWRSFDRPHHLRRWFRLNVANGVAELLRREPDRNGYFLGQFELLERDRADIGVEGRALVAKRLAAIRDVAARVAAGQTEGRLVLAVIPAPVQVCGPRELAYWPRFVDLSDTTRFDLDRPQRLARGLAAELGLVAYDLRPPLLAALAADPQRSPYQRRNLHWTAAGHEAVARWLAARLFTDGLTGGAPSTSSAGDRLAPATPEVPRPQLRFPVSESMGKVEVAGR